MANDDLIMFMDYLASRWDDERGYEDFTDYVEAVKARVEKEGGVFRSLTREPFVLTYQDKDGLSVKLTVGPKAIHQETEVRDERAPGP